MTENRKKIISKDIITLKQKIKKLAKLQFNDIIDSFNNELIIAEEVEKLNILLFTLEERKVAIATVKKLIENNTFNFRFNEFRINFEKKRFEKTIKIIIKSITFETKFVCIAMIDLELIDLIQNKIVQAIYDIDPRDEL